MPCEESTSCNDSENVENCSTDYRPDPKIRFRDKSSNHVGKKLWWARALKNKEEKGGKSLRFFKICFACRVGRLERHIMSMLQDHNFIEGSF